MLVGVEDVGAVAVKEAADGGDNALAVGAVHQQGWRFWRAQQVPSWFRLPVYRRISHCCIMAAL
jgi:hypothetical protein